jgi:hypothetical protein
MSIGQLIFGGAAMARRSAIPNSERVYAISADQGSSKRFDLNEISRVLASKKFEFGIAENCLHSK